MATVHYFEAAAETGSALLSIWMPKIHELLLGAGWTIEYADADAIGTGSAGEPAWDKTPAVNTDAGVAVYRMPASSHATRWFVRVRPGWAASTARPHMRGLQVGVTHDGSGTLTGGNAEQTPPVTLSQTNNRAWRMNASEDGFFYYAGIGSTTEVVAYVERIRLLDESVQDEVIALNRYALPRGDFVSATAGVTDWEGKYVILAANGALSTSVESIDAFCPYADAWVFQGPYWLFGNPLTGLPRLWRQAPLSHVRANDSVMVNVDGGLKTYKAFSSEFSAMYGVIVVATE